MYPNEDCKDAITLTNDDVWRLGNEEFLNDSLVDYYLKYIVKTLEDSPEGKAKLSRCHFFNSFFYKRLTECMGKSSGRRGGGKSPGSGYESVRRCTKNVDIFTKDFLFVPINESLHWSLAVVCWPGKIKDLDAPLPVKSFDIFDRPDTPPAGAAAASDRDLSSLHRVPSSRVRNAPPPPPLTAKPTPLPLSSATRTTTTTTPSRRGHRSPVAIPSLQPQRRASAARSGG